MPHLHPAVMTSSSTRNYGDLFREVARISNANRFDLFILRDSDIEQIGLELAERGRMSDVVSDEGNFERIQEWILNETEGQPIRIPSLATYFPDLTSTHGGRRNRAIHAVANCVRLAISLTERDPNQMESPVVEIVCGTVIESAGAGGPVRVFGAGYKIEVLCQSLKKVLDIVNRDDVPYALALELEPGETYVLNGPTRLLSASREIEKDARLVRHVGFNFDIAHMRIVQLHAKGPEHIVDRLRPIVPRIVHAHISDHPGIHTHDQIVGRWTNAQCTAGGYQPYLKCLLDRSYRYHRELESGADPAQVLPFTGAIGIELEGSNRIFAIHDSIKRLEHAIAIAEKE